MANIVTDMTHRPTDIIIIIVLQRVAAYVQKRGRGKPLISIPIRAEQVYKKS